MNILTFLYHLQSCIAFLIIIQPFPFNLRLREFSYDWSVNLASPTFNVFLLTLYVHIYFQVSCLLLPYNTANATMIRSTDFLKIILIMWFISFCKAKMLYEVFVLYWVAKLFYNLKCPRNVCQCVHTKQYRRLKPFGEAFLCQWASGI